MKRLFAMALCLFSSSYQGGFVRAQGTIVAFDTLRLQHIDYYQNDYTIDDTLITSISIQNAAVKQLNDVHFKFGENVFGGAMTLVTGIGFGGAKDVDWYLASDIRTNNQKLDWIFDVYCPGYVEKERTRVTNSDGSHSVETNYVNRFSWQKGALGFIIEAGDTIGWHYIHREPRTDTSLQKYSQTVYNGNQEHTAINYREFALLGQFNGKESSVLFNSTDNRIYMFTGDELSGIYDCQKPPLQLTFNKKKRKFNQPYLLINLNLSACERMDILRLAMVGLRIKNAIESFY
jgi:hypothetical protein